MEKAIQLKEQQITNLDTLLREKIENILRNACLSHYKRY
jgi:hypothetical protein